MTPKLPDWIKEGRLEHESEQIAGYKSAHAVLRERGLADPRLYGTEAMYGDWNGRVLLLAKDFGPTMYLRDQIAGGCMRPYHHAPSLKTNVYLMQLAAPFAIGDDPSNCGLLYGSALANLCRDDGEWSGALPNRSAALKYGSAVLKWVLMNGCAIETIVCMGAEAWEVVRKCLFADNQTSFVDARGAHQPFTTNCDGRVFRTFVVKHPARAGSIETQRRAWNPIHNFFASV